MGTAGMRLADSFKTIRLELPFAAGALAFALCGVLAVATSSVFEARKLNAAQVEAERGALAAALGRQLGETSRDLRQLVGDPIALVLAQANPAGTGFDQVLAAPAPAVVARLKASRWTRAAREDVTGSVGPAGAAPSGSSQGFVFEDGRTYAAAAAGERTVALRLMDETFLGRASQMAQIGPLQLSTAVAAAAATLPLADEPGAGAAVSWQPRRPGDALLQSRGAWLAALTAAISLALLGLVWRAATRLRGSQAEIDRLSAHDLLSGLPNRFVFSQMLDAELARCAAQGGRCAYIALDIDRLKETNDGFGHDAGDRLIVGIAERIASVLAPGDRLSRMDGDEFAILQTGISGPQDGAALAARILDVLKEPLDLGAMRMSARLSIGIAVHPEDAASRPDLMQAADQALTRAKHEGRNRFAFFEKRLRDDMRERKTTEAELRQAIDEGGLRVLYQPIMTADGSRMACVEALVRWQHPVRGLVPPDHFISLAEERGLIIALGEWVLRQACRDGRQWPGVRLAVNVSPVQFRQKDFAVMVERVLAEEGFDPAHLELELTEGVVIADAEQAETVMMDLRGLGVRLALDDFGTGYSSLVYLRRFAFDKIKIDRSFLESMESTGESAIIVHSIIHLGRALGLTVTAEGIETAEQQRFLFAAGVHELQGYLFSRPVVAAEIGRMLGIAAEPQRAAG